MSSSQLLIKRWLAQFGPTSPVFTRQVVEMAWEDRELRSALEAVVPGFSQQQHPRFLTAWLSKNENLLMTAASGARYRFSRMPGTHRWRLIRAVEDRVDAA